MRRPDRRRDRRSGRGVDLRGAAGAARRGSRHGYLAEHLRSDERARPHRMAGSGRARPRAVDRRRRGGRRQVRDAARRVPVGDGGARATAGSYHGCDVRIRWLASDELGGAATEAPWPSWTGSWSRAASASAAWRARSRRSGYARERGVPFLGLCLGLQCAVIEFARNVCGLEGANSSEFDPETPHPVIDLLPEQKGVIDMGGDDAAGRASRATSCPGTKAAAAYGEPTSWTSATATATRSTPRTTTSCATHGLVLSGMSPEGPADRDHRAPGPPVLRGRAVPPGAPFAPDPARTRCFRDFVAAARAARARRRAPPANGSSSPAETGCRSRWALAEAWDRSTFRVWWRIGRARGLTRPSEHHAVGVVPLTPDGDVVLVRQFRPPVRDALTEIPAGLLDVDGEDADDVRRTRAPRGDRLPHGGSTFLGGYVPVARVHRRVHAPVPGAHDAAAGRTSPRPASRSCACRSTRRSRPRGRALSATRRPRLRLLLAAAQPPP